MTIANLRPAPVTLPEGPRLALDRNIAALTRMEGFEDRVQYAAEAVVMLQSLAFSGVIDATQHAHALRRIRTILQGDLGVIVTADYRSVFDLPPLDEVTP